MITTKQALTTKQAVHIVENAQQTLTECAREIERLGALKAELIATMKDVRFALAMEASNLSLPLDTRRFLSQHTAALEAAIKKAGAK
jgi:hypothetical protein